MYLYIYISKDTNKWSKLEFIIAALEARRQWRKALKILLEYNFQPAILYTANLQL